MTPHPSASAAVHLTPWQLVRVARDGTHLTVYTLAPAGSCIPVVVPRVVQSATSVGIGMTYPEGGAVSCGAGANSPLANAVTLDAPLGDRPLIDLSGNARRQTFLDSELPEFPAGVGWHEVLDSTYDFRHGVFLGVLFERGDGVDVNITALIQIDGGLVSGAKMGTVTLGRRTGQVYTFGASYKVVWMVGDEEYTLRFEPKEGQSESLTAFKDLLSTLHWTQGP